MENQWFYYLPDMGADDFLDIYGILYECPLGKRLATCAVNDKIDLSFKEKFNWVENLDLKNKSILINKHKACAFKRLESFKKH